MSSLFLVSTKRGRSLPAKASAERRVGSCRRWGHAAGGGRAPRRRVGAASPTPTIEQRLEPGTFLSGCSSSRGFALRPPVRRAASHREPRPFGPRSDPPPPKKAVRNRVMCLSVPRPTTAVLPARGTIPAGCRGRRATVRSAAARRRYLMSRPKADSFFFAFVFFAFGFGSLYAHLTVLAPRGFRLSVLGCVFRAKFQNVICVGVCAGLENKVGRFCATKDTFGHLRRYFASKMLHCCYRRVMVLRQLRIQVARCLCSRAFRSRSW